MPPTERVELDTRSAPFEHYKAIRPLATARSGRAPDAHARHQLYAAVDRRTNVPALVKVTARPGLFYEQNINNEIASLTSINRALPDSRHFPLVLDHGRLRDGRVFLITTLFDEFPLATTIGAERASGRLVSHLRTAVAASRVVAELHRVPVIHVDLNPMNILYRTERGGPVIRVVDFESSFEPHRHGPSAHYDPPTTPGYSAPEIPAERPDARADIFSLGAVLYTLMAGYGWTWRDDITRSVARDTELDDPLRAILLSAVDHDRTKRYESMAEFGAALTTYLEVIWPGRAWQEA